MAIGDLQLPLYPWGSLAPMMTPMAKAQSNVTASNIPGARIPGPYDFLNAMTSLSNVQGENALRQEQAKQMQQQALLTAAQVGLTQKAGEPPPPMYLPGSLTGAASPQPSAGTGPATGASGTASPDIDTVTAGDSPEWRAFAQAVAGPESKGRFDVRYGPNGAIPFDDYSKHPNIAEKSLAGPSTAAGAWQITKSTYDTLPEEQRPDFKPETQYNAFKEIARRDYGAMTGRNLDADLR